MIVEFAPYLVRELVQEVEPEYQALELFLQMIEWKLTMPQAKEIANLCKIEGFNTRELFEFLG